MNIYELLVENLGSCSYNVGLFVGNIGVMQADSKRKMLETGGGDHAPTMMVDILEHLLNETLLQNNIRKMMSVVVMK